MPTATRTKKRKMHPQQRAALRRIQAVSDRYRSYGTFDEDRARRAVDFIQMLPNIKGRKWAGKKIELRPFQRIPTEDIFGIVDENGHRVIRKVYIEMPKKNGKSTWAAPVALYLTFADGEPSAEIYSLAYDKFQARVVFDLAVQMVKRTPALSRRSAVKEGEGKIYVPSTDSVYLPLSRISAGKHGPNVHGIILDEFHTQRTPDLHETLEEGMAGRDQPLEFIITNSGVDRETPCWEFHQYARDLIAERIPPDPTFYPMILSAVDDDREFETVDWEDEKRWYRANPALGDFLPIDHMRSKAQQVKEMASLQNSFKQLRLSIWPQQFKHWLPIEKWDDCAAEIDEKELRGRTCYGGLDLGAVDDLCAWALMFPDEEDVERVTLLVRCWCPESRLYAKDNRYAHAYQVWEDEGWLVATPGEATDYNFIKKQILDDASTFRLVDMAVDRLFQAHHLSNQLMDEGIEVIGTGMGVSVIGAATREFEARVTKKQVLHRKNPLLRWTVGNTVVRLDEYGNPKPDKKNSQGKIDPVTASVLALDRAMRHEGHLPQRPRVLPRLLRRG